MSETAVVYGSMPTWPEKIRENRERLALTMLTATRGWRIP